MKAQQYNSLTGLFLLVMFTLIACSTPGINQPGLSVSSPSTLVINGDLNTLYHSSVVLRNSGGAPLVFSVVSDAAWLTVTPDEETLGAGESVTLDVAARCGVDAATHSGSFTIDSNAGKKALTVELTCAGAPEVSELSADSVALSSLAGDTAQAEVSFMNDGSAALTFEVTSDKSWLNASPATGTLAPQGTQRIQVDALCPPTVQTLSGTLTFAFNDADEPEKTVRVLLDCTGSDGRPIMSAPNPDVITLKGDVTETVADTLVLKNIGNADLSYDVTSQNNVLSFSNNATGTLAPNTQVSVRFFTQCPANPTTLTDTLSINSNDSSNNASTIPVSIQCDGPDITALTPQTLTLSTTVNTSVNSSVSFSNSGSKPLAFSSEGLQNWLVVSPASGVVAAGGTQVLGVTATCSNAVRTRSGRVAVSSDDPDEAFITADVSLDCVEQETPPPAMSDVTPDPLELIALLDKRSVGTLSFSNEGEGLLTYQVSEQVDWLSLRSAATGELAAGERAEIDLRATCSDEVAIYETFVTVTSNDPVQPERSARVALSCVTSVDWDLSPAKLTFEAVTGEAFGTKRVTLSNTGETSGAFTVTASEPWLRVNPLTGTLAAGAERTLNVDVDACTDTGVSTAVLSVTGENAQATLDVTRRCLDEAPQGDLSLARFYINQSVPAVDTAQASSEQIPLIQNRAGLARAFVLATTTDSPVPEVVMHYRSGNKSGSITLQAPSSMPKSVDESQLGASFNTLLAKTFFRSNVEIYIEVDPDNLIPETDENNNRYPASGYVSLPVNETPDFNVTLVPVYYNGVLPDVTNANKNDYLDSVQRMHPVADINITIHPPYTFNGNLNDPYEWEDLLNELTTLRTNDGSSDLYYGIVTPGYTSGVAGLGWIGYPVAVGWSNASSTADVAAHEIGHTWDRRHAPCGNPDGVDVGFPYANAYLGVWGFDYSSGSLKAPTKNYDIMSYCDPSWISDYTFKSVLDYRMAEGYVVKQAAASSSMLAPESGKVLLIQGEINSSGARLAPVFEVAAEPQLPAAGEYVLQGLAADGSVILRVPFRAYEMADVDALVFGFSFSVPVPERALARLQVLENSRVLTEQVLQLGAQAVATPRVSRQGNIITVQWGQGFERLMVRDVTTGVVLAQDTTGRVDVISDSRELELIFSRGLTSVQQRVVIE